jgi:hypothetical protein
MTLDGLRHAFSIVTGSSRRQQLQSICGKLLLVIGI